MARKTRRGAEAPELRKNLLRQRLHLIKKRYEELIIRPRQGLLQGYLEDDGFEEIEEAEEEYEVLDGYGLARGM